MCHHSLSRSTLLFLFAGYFLNPPESPSAEPQPPKGFAAIFNGTDLAGWHGWNIHAAKAGPYDLEKMTPEERAKKSEDWTADAKMH